ncbi:hypothetical protein CLV36_11323 [Laceyella sediminis]|jgi:endogenous inhibitor of DNA gyrase (YacG/DUF329 family)|uniref:Rubredoxin-like domain-containing protein n=1 Tax=Laceyella sediminis TaxID=573074 RepID=A0ABX5EKY2_9BACL|nr:hypothetical protein CLV36_11323 [Laceyella sediminis]
MKMAKKYECPECEKEYETETSNPICPECSKGGTKVYLEEK